MGTDNSNELGNLREPTKASNKRFKENYLLNIPRMDGKENATSETKSSGSKKRKSKKKRDELEIER